MGISNELRENRVACCVFRFESLRHTLHVANLQLLGNSSAILPDFIPERFPIPASKDQ